MSLQLFDFAHYQTHKHNSISGTGFREIAERGKISIVSQVIAVAVGHRCWLYLLAFASDASPTRPRG